MNILHDKRKVFSGSKVSVYEYDLEFSNGNNARYEMVQFDVETGVCALPVRGREVLLVRHFQAGVMSTLWTLPSGGLELDEIPEERMQMELQEEVGYKAGKLTLLARPHLLPGYIVSSPGYLYLAEDLEASRLPGDEEYAIETKWMSFEKAMQMVYTGALQDARTVLGLFYYQHLIGK